MWRLILSIAQMKKTFLPLSVALFKFGLGNFICVVLGCVVTEVFANEVVVIITLNVVSVAFVALWSGCLYDGKGFAVEVFKVVSDFDDVIMTFGVAFVALWSGVGDFTQSPPSDSEVLQIM